MRFLVEVIPVERCACEECPGLRRRREGEKFFEYRCYAWEPSREIPVEALMQEVKFPDFCVLSDNAEVLKLETTAAWPVQSQPEEVRRA